MSGHEECHDLKLAELPYVSLQFVTVVPFNIFQPLQPFQPFAVSILQVFLAVSTVSCLRKSQRFQDAAYAAVQLHTESVLERLMPYRPYASVFSISSLRAIY